MRGPGVGCNKWYMPKIFIKVLCCDWLKDNQMVGIIGQFDRKEADAVGLSFSRGCMILTWRL